MTARKSKTTKTDGLTDDELAEAMSSMSRDDLTAMQAEAFRVSTLVAAELASRSIDVTEGA